MVPYTPHQSITPQMDVGTSAPRKSSADSQADLKREIIEGPFLILLITAYSRYRDYAIFVYIVY